MTKGRQRSQLVELCRFVASVLIVCHHSEMLGHRTHFVAGWVFVEFFFMLTGYFTARHVARRPPSQGPFREAVHYTRDKLARVVPFAWTGVALGVVAMLLRANLADEWLRMLLSVPYNLLFLQGLPLHLPVVNYDVPLWYLTALMLFLPLLVATMRRMPSAYRRLLCWFVPLVLLGHNLVVVGKLSVWEAGVPKLMRGLADLMLGTLAYTIAEWVRGRATDRAMLLVRLGGVASFAALCAIAGVLGVEGYEASVALVALAFVATLLVVTNERNYVEGRTPYALCGYLGALSMPLFCLHYPVGQIVQTCVPTLSYEAKLLLCLAASVGLSALALGVIRGRTYT